MIRNKVVCTVMLSQLFAFGAFAAARVEQKTQVHFGGAIGGIVNAFGGKAAREGVVSTVVVKGDRKSTVTASTGEIIDLQEEKIYRIDYDRKTYKVVTFDELRKQMQQAQERAARNSRSHDKNEGPEYQIDVDIKDTGKKQVINGYNTKETLVTVTVREKGKTLEQSGGAVMKADMWMGPRIAAMREMEDFDRKYVTKLFAGTSTGADMQQMAMMMAQTPAFGQAMKKFEEKRSSFEGSAIRTDLSFDVVGGAEQSASERDEAASPSDAAARAIGGLLGKMKKRNEQPSSSSASAAPEPASLFNSTTEILKADTSATDADVALPAGFKKVN